MRIIQKDITTVGAPAIIAHGVNCQRAMGSGVAKALYTKWPKVREAYMARTRMVIGEVQFVDVEPGIVVANCFTQDQYGYDGAQYAKLDGILNALHEVAAYDALVTGLDVIHIPRIGCGLGGLDWRDLEPQLKVIEGYMNAEFVVCDHG